MIHSFCRSIIIQYEYLRNVIFKLLISSKNKYQFERNKYQNCHQVEKYNHYINDCLKTDFKAGKLNIKPSIMQYAPVNIQKLMKVLFSLIQKKGYPSYCVEI